MAGWIRFSERSGTIRETQNLFPVASLPIALRNDPGDTRGTQLVLGGTHVICDDPEAEFNRLEAWLDNGGEGLYVVGEWPYPPRGSECESCSEKATHMDRDGGTFCCECWTVSGGEISREPAESGVVAELVEAVERYLQASSHSFPGNFAYTVGETREMLQEALAKARREASA